MRSILIHVKNDEIIDKYASFIKYGYKDNYSHEIKALINEFSQSGYKIYLTSIDNYDFEYKSYKRIYSVSEDENISLSMEELNILVDVMVIRVIGSVEANFDLIKDYLTDISNHYKGLVINNPKAMMRGMTKNYLTELEDEAMAEIGIKRIPTDIYDRKISYPELKDNYDDLSKYIIKPLSGELSNSLANLGRIDDSFLRLKEEKVQGWVIQPIMDEVWNGEYQMVYLDDYMMYSQYKEYLRNNALIPNQKQRVLHKYHPSDEEIIKGQKLIEYIENKYKIDTYISRIDYFKDINNIPILLEFEMVNPGFFIGYMDEQDEDIKNITRHIRVFCDKKIQMKK